MIADNVGDNVGDCAGMAADLFETYVVTVGATMVLSALFLKTGAADLMALPLIIGGVCIVTSIIGTFFVRLGSKQSIMGALYKGFLVTSVLSLIAIYFAMDWALGAEALIRRSPPQMRAALPAWIFIYAVWWGWL